MKSNVRRKRIAEVVADKALQQGSSPELAREVAAYLVEEGRTGDLDSIMRDVQGEWAEAGFVEVIAVSAHDLTDEIQDNIMSLVRPLFPNAERIVITHEQDPDIIGGVKISVANLQLDMTLDAKLDRFKQLTTAGKE